MARVVDLILSQAERHVPATSVMYITGVDNWQADFLSWQSLDQGLILKPYGVP